MRTIKRNSKEFKAILENAKMVEVITDECKDCSINYLKATIDRLPKMYSVWESKQNEITVWFHSNLAFTITL